MVAAGAGSSKFRGRAGSTGAIAPIELQSQYPGLCAGAGIELIAGLIAGLVFEPCFMVFAPHFLVDCQ